VFPPHMLDEHASWVTLSSGPGSSTSNEALAEKESPEPSTPSSP
jgi:hypothetical protein